MTTKQKPTVKATKAVQELAERNSGIITPEIVLDAAKRKSSPLHPFFNWDDTKAAREYRLIQAAQLIRRIKVTIPATENRNVRIRAFVNIHEKPAGADEEPKARGIYVPLADAMRHEDWREQLLKSCKRDVETFRSKYAALREAEPIIAAMENAKLEIV